MSCIQSDMRISKTWPVPLGRLRMLARAGFLTRKYKLVQEKMIQPIAVSPATIMTELDDVRPWGPFFLAPSLTHPGLSLSSSMSAPPKGSLKTKYKHHEPLQKNASPAKHSWSIPNIYFSFFHFLNYIFLNISALLSKYQGYNSTNTHSPICHIGHDMYGK